MRTTRTRFAIKMMQEVRQEYQIKVTSPLQIQCTPCDHAEWIIYPSRNSLRNPRAKTPVLEARSSGVTISEPIAVKISSFTALYARRFSSTPAWHRIQNARKCHLFSCPYKTLTHKEIQSRTWWRVCLAFSREPGPQMMNKIGRIGCHRAVIAGQFYHLNIRADL